MVFCLSFLLLACLLAIIRNWAIRGKEQAKGAYYLDRENLHGGTMVRIVSNNYEASNMDDVLSILIVKLSVRGGGRIIVSPCPCWLRIQDFKHLWSSQRTASLMSGPQPTSPG
jgi:hypothetical protein